MLESDFIVVVGLLGGYYVAGLEREEWKEEEAYLDLR